MPTIPEYRYHVYVLSSSQGVFYVGCGTKERLQHTRMVSTFKTKKHQKIQELHARGESVQLDVVYSTDDREKAFQCEQYFITAYGSCLTNVKGNRPNRKPSSHVRKGSPAGRKQTAQDFAQGKRPWKNPRAERWYRKHRASRKG